MNRDEININKGCFEMSFITWMILIVVGFFIIKAACGIWYTSQASANPHYWRISMLNDIHRRAGVLRQRGFSQKEAFMIAVDEKVNIIEGFTSDHPARQLFIDMMHRELKDAAEEIDRSELF